MNYDAMTDQEINREVASYFYCENWLSRHAEMLGMIPDYCNEPSDAWPIIFENKISTEWCNEDNWKSECNNQFKPGKYTVFMSIDENPLRAAMICFLKMKDAEK